jgi:ATP-binding cassette subfamily B protein
MQAVGASERIFEILDRSPKVAAPANPKELPAHRAGSVIFDNVCFAYPSRPDQMVINKLSFEIAEGQTVAFVGTSGAGKSTVASLIPRFYDPQAGEIYYCGVPLKDLDPQTLLEEISVVPQDPQVFSVSIAENIAYGSPQADPEAIQKAAEAANIDEFVKSLANGYNTLVGDRGIQLSGGQRQRIAIARALLKDPKFLILDEATSSLDSENEVLVQQALSRLMENRTTMVIAHRLSTVQHADSVIVLEHGVMTQFGTHKTLVQTPGLYQTLVEHQLLEA